MSPVRWIWEEVNVNLNLLRENRLRKYSAMAWWPFTDGWCGGISTPSGAQTATQRSASEAFTAARNSAVVFMIAARSASAASGVFIRCHSTTKIAELRIDTIDPAYYTVAHGDGQTTTASEADIDVGCDTRSATHRRASVL